MGRFWGRTKQIVTNRLWLYLAGLLAFIIIMMLAYTELNVSALYQYFNGPLILWMLFLFLFVMFVAGIGKDFINGFRLAFSKRKDTTRMELQKAAKAMGAAIKIVVLESMVAVGLRMVHFLFTMREPLQLLGPLVWVLFLSVVYSAVFSLVLIPLRVRLENMAISFMEETGEGKENDAEQDGQTVYFRLRAMGLTDREAEVARLVCCGLANKEIGQMLYISDTTVKKHMTHILEKANCDSREALAQLVQDQN